MAIKIQIQAGREDAAWLGDLLRSVGDDAEIVVISDDRADKFTSGPEGLIVSGPEDVLPGDVLAAFREKVSPDVSPLLAGFASAEMQERGARAFACARYVRLHAPGPRYVGAYAYVHYTGYASLRLPAEYADSSEFGYRPAITAATAYGVRVPLTSTGAVTEAHRLAAEACRLALEYEVRSAH